jgi:LysM repeat protein
VGAASGGTTTAGGGKTYTVRRGDTLGAIADRNGVGLSTLLNANGLGRRSTIYPGQQLVIP